MSAILFERLRQLRSRIVRLLAVYGFSLTALVFLTTTVLAGFFDWWVHFDDPGVRLILGSSILALTGFTLWRSLWRPVRKQFADVELALRIERRHPGFRDSLASTIQFLQSSEANEGRADERLGSAALQQKVITQTLKQAERIDLEEILEPRPVYRAAGAAFVVGLLVLGLVAIRPSSALLALQRLAFPFSAAQWPRKADLRLLTDQWERVPTTGDPTLRIPMGGTLELYVENANGPVPADLRMEVTPDSGPSRTEKLRRATLRPADGVAREYGVVSIAALRSGLKFRVIGGDDDRMPPLQVAVVPPPVVESFQVVTTPPAYTRRRPETLLPEVGDVTAVVGASVEVKARASKPLEHAWLRIKDRSPTAMTLSEDGLSFQTTFSIADSGAYSYWFDLRDREGFENPNAPRYEIRGTPDLPPDVSIELPVTDARVTADAVVPFRVISRDDLFLKSVALSVRINERVDGGGHLVPLYPEGGEPEDSVQQHVGSHDLSLAPFGLSPGDRVLVQGEATDAYDLGPVHLGRSIARVLTIVSADEKANEIASRQSALVDELERDVDELRKSRDQVAQLHLQLEKAGALRSGDVDLLKRVEIDHRQLASRIAGPVDSLESRSRELVSELEQNHLVDDAMSLRLKSLSDAAASLRHDHLPSIEQGLTQVRKSTDQDRPGSDGAASAEADLRNLKDVEARQEAAIDALTDQLNQLAEWRSRRDVAADLNELIAAQKQLNAESAETGSRTLGRANEELSTQEQADLARLADRQSRLGDRAAQFRNKLSDIASELDESNRESAERLRGMQEELRRTAVAEKMRDAADELEKNRIGQATQRQQELVNELGRIQSQLHESRPSDLESLAKRLKSEESELEKLIGRQETLQKKVDAAASDPDAATAKDELTRLKKELESRQKETEEALRRLRKLQSKKPAEALRRAAEQTQKAGASVESNPDAAAEAVEESLDDLKQARRELARERKEVEEQLAQELMEKIVDELRAIVPRQQAVIEETERLQNEFLVRGNWSRGQLKSLQALAETQRGIQAETTRLAAKIEAAEVFSLALRGAARMMETAVQRLSERKTDSVTVDAEKGAARRFQSLIDALAEKPGPAKNEGAGDEGPQAPPEGAGSDARPSDGIPQLAQLKLLKAMQEEILARTDSLDALRRNAGAWTPELQAELEAIALEQGQLADLARNLMRKASSKTGLPDEPTEDRPSRGAEPEPTGRQESPNGRTPEARRRQDRLLP